ncbi:hypothetical protein FKW77_004973 [Venturia effusa]|uniref:Uncharacterized protein n=1 Tax=Venturia effusa TaxID=50376 RepID=A0A517KWA3_9PEZI|nr:hypothetical protein FKW77_004973 [Venturia effusa]
MPPFGIKAFTRRKSAGNSLDVTGEGNLATTPSTGFRVIPRDEAHRKSIGTLDAPNIPYQAARQSSYDEDSNSSNRGSNSSAATSKSRIFDPPATRYSSSSTLHSPAEPVLKKAQSSPNWLNFSEDLDTGFDDDMFSGLSSSNRRGRANEQPSSVRQPPAALRINYEADLPKRDSQQSPFWNRRNSTDKLMASPQLSESPVYDEPPPPPPPHKDTPNALKTFSLLRVGDSSSDELSPPLPNHELRNQPSFNRSPDGNEDADARLVRESVRSVREGPNSRNSGYEGSPLSRADDNMDKGLFAPQGKVVSHSSSDNSLKTPSAGSSGSSTPLHDSPSFVGHSRDITPVSSNLQGSSSNSTTPRATKMLPTREKEEESDFGSSVVSAIRQTENRSMLGLPTHIKSESQTGVMTAAQFAALKEQEKKVVGNGKAPVESESDDDYEDDSDDEEVQAQKRKLQAHKEAQHAIWRQRMKKDIGDHSSPARPGFSRNNMSAPNLGLTQSNAGSDDEDDDVPLAILQAHNFPNHNRPPDPRNSSNSFVSNQIPRPDSAGGRPNSKARQSNLPIFAPRVNPQDLPYVGADLVQGGNREQLKFNNPGAMLQYGAAPRGPPPRNANLPPNGLIGIIVDEERGKAARRGSPNGPNGMGYLPATGQMSAMPGMGPQMPMGQMSGYGMPVDPQFQQQQQQIAALQQQIALQQQLYELQSQNMHLGMGGGSVMGSGQSMMGVAPMMSNQSIMGQPFMAGGNQYGNRPMSVAASGGVGPRHPLHQARTMSMASQSGFMQPNGRAMNMTNFNLPTMGNLPPFAPGYAASVAPSERSTIGQPSRYKPVSFPDGGSTITAGSTAAQPANTILKKKSSGGFLNAVIYPGGKKSPSVNKTDDEDEEDWGKVLRKRKGAKTET